MKFLDNLLKKPEKDRKAAYKPSSPETKAVQNTGGGSKGSRRDMDFGEGGPSKEQRKRILASQNDNAWGYHDMNTGKYVPWYIDIRDGGGKNTSGDTFEGAGLYSAALNAAGVAPYGFNRPRTYAQAGMENRPSLPAPPPTPEVSRNYSNMSSGVNPSNAYVPDYTRPEIEVNKLPPENPNFMSIDQMQRMINPLINNTEEGLLQQEYRPEMVDPMLMIAMLRDQENRRRNQPPTLLG